MNKERIKSFILILLILNSINLTVQMWFDSNLWPGGFGFAENMQGIPVIGRFFGSGDSQSVAYSGEQLYEITTKPRRIIVNGGGAREIFAKESDYYNEAMQYINVLLSEPENMVISQITYEEWKNLFKAKSVFVDYGYCMDYASLNRLYGISNSAGQFRQATNFSGFIITPDDVMGTCTLCTLNEADNVVTKFTFDADTQKILKFIENTTYQKQQNDAFSFEINLDTMTTAENEVERQVSFSPMTLLNVSPELERDAVLTAGDIFGSSEELEVFAERMLGVFGHKPSSLRKTVQSDGTITFVENKATIKFYYDGTIEYNAVSKENGMKISNSSANSYQAICDVLGVAAMLWDKSGIEAQNLDYHLASDYTDNKENVYTVNVDNMFEGVVINYNNVTEHAISAKVEDGYITNLVVHLSNISKSEQKREILPVLMAIDTVYASEGSNGMIIDDVYKCYDFDESGKGVTKWVFEVRDRENNLVVDLSDFE